MSIRTTENAPANFCLQETVECGANAHRGNLVGIQPFLEAADYTSEGSFHTKLDGYFGIARQKGWFTEKTTVVLPEYVGTWLVAVEEKERVYRAESIKDAMQTLVFSHPLSFAKKWLFARAKDRVKYSLFRIKAAKMAEIYQNVFAELAQGYTVTVVAGSILLPSPQISQGRLTIGDGNLYNISVAYKPDGTAYPSLVRKVFPIEDELGFTTPASVQDLPVFDTPGGRLGVLICADAWYTASYEALRAKGVELIAVPSYLSADDVWEKPWRGYTGASAPDDVDGHGARTHGADSFGVSGFTEGEAWLKYGLAGRIGHSGARHGITVFLRGNLWDMGSDGHTILIREQSVIEARHVAGAAIINSWL